MNYKHIGYGGTLTIDGKEIEATFDASVQCPFSILREFELWFAWHRRVIANGEDSLLVTSQMTGFLKHLKEQLMKSMEEVFTKLPDYDSDNSFMFRVRHDFRPTMPRFILANYA